MKNTIILLTTLALAMFFALPCAAQDFQSGDLLYEIISEDPPEVTVAGHVDGQDAQGELNIPATVTFEGTEYTVAEISWYAFRGCHGLTGTLVIPNTVRVIGEYAFFECDGLSGSLEFPESVQEVRVGAFCQCTGFTGTLTFPESTTEVGNGRYNYNLSPSGAFQGCLGFDRLELPASLRFIGYCCFADCPNLKGQLSIPDGVTRIEIEAFSHDTGFTGELVLPESLESVEDRAFAGCTGIESLVLPSHFIFYTYWSSNEQRTAKSVFEGCNGLASVEIPEGWERTGPHIFENCTNLVSVHLPESLREINGVCFGNCASLSEINLPKGLTDIGGEAFSGCVSLTSIDLPDSLALLSNAFRGCTGLTGDMVIPDLVEKLWPFTFEGCMGLKHVILGSSINFVYEAAFNDTNLESLVIRAETPPTLDRMDMPYLPWDFPADLPIIVPCGTLEAYQNAEGWNEFSNISEGNTFILKVLTDDEHKGSVTITKEPVCGDMDVVLEATSMDGKSFVCWKVNDETVSTDNPYRFELAQDTEITAVFSVDYESDFLGQIGSEWYYEILNDDGSITYQHLEYVADTTFDNKEVKIIIRNNTLYDKSRRDAVTKEYLYEENNIVYWWNATIEQFTVLYGFGAQQGDEWEIRVGAETLTMHVDAVEQYEYEGRVFKMMRVSDPENLFSGMIICGIGHLTSFFPEKLMNPGKAYRVEGIRCFWQQGELVFKYGEKDCEEVYEQYHNDIDETTTDAFQIYPNPTDGIVIVEMSSETSRPGEFRVTNLTGQTLLTGPLTGEKQTIDLSGLPKGVYFLTINNRTQKMIRQ